ncbi:Gfo/Idh/MocA family oxidoreductase [Actinopolymorpha sp. B11F2]|uniref:Gfo/Idh/MocA family protein n=1 Tax=Actinopolymorpha sp. B11F2 TaxID=3160862 RepID=UPI0032E4E4DE
MESTGIGIVGCGNVSRMYLPILARIPDVDVVAVADVDAARAQQTVEEFDLPRAMSAEELIADPAVDVVLNLTPIVVHTDVSKAALTAGKHVYSEKPLATSVVAARELVDEARRRGLAFGCAPDTLLGSGFEAAREVVASGAIGRPLAASAAMFRSAMTRASFYSEGATPIFDMAPYYLSALVNVFGPAVRISGLTRTLSAGETPVEPPAGGSIASSGVIEFASGVLANVTLVWGSDHRHEVPAFTVYGSTGVVDFPNPNNFGDPAYVRQHGEESRTEIPGSRQPESWPRNLRGLGVGEMARAIRAGQTPRAGAEIACHVVEMIEGLVTSARTGSRVELTTTCTPAPPLSAEARESLVG